MTLLLWVAATALVLAGLAGTVLPALPGPILVFAGLLLAAWADGFARVGWPTIALLGLLTAAAYLVDLAAAAVGAALGTLLGLFVGLPGVIIGPFAGAVIGEVSARRSLKGAGRAGVAAWTGFLLGALVKLGLVFTMVGLFLASVFLF